MVLLHGFAGTRRSWDRVVAEIDGERYRPLALDLPGHGAARHERQLDLAACVAAVSAQAPARFALCGYSMGGRIALHLALARPARVTRLVLVATTAGIEDDDERARRRADDARLAAAIEGEPIEAFAERWMAQPLFAGASAVARAAWREDLLRNDPRALAGSLRAVGPGSLAPLWERLGELELPVTIIVGERDARYRAIGERMMGAIAQARLVVVPGAGHGLPREAPAELAGAL